MPYTTSIKNNAVINYTNTNEWLQQAAVAAGAGKDIWPPKPTVQDATEIVNAFRAYQDVTLGALEKFMGAYLRFEQTGRVFKTNHELTKAILDDCVSRGVIVDDRMVAFVSTSAHAVSSDATFINMFISSLESGPTNPLVPQSTLSTQDSATTSDTLSVSAHISAGINAFLFKTGFKGSADHSALKQNLQQKVTTGTSTASVYREALTGISAIYGLEQSGVLPHGQFVKTMINMSSLANAYTGDYSADSSHAKEALTKSGLAIDSVNMAIQTDQYLHGFILSFCQDNYLDETKKSHPDSDTKMFWLLALEVIQSRSNDIPALMHQYADHHSTPEVHMLMGLIQMQRILSITCENAVKFLKTGLDSLQYSESSKPQHNDRLAAVYISPILKEWGAVAVTGSAENRDVTAKPIRLIDVAKLFPAMKPYMIDKGVNLAINSDLWDSAIIEMDNVNNDMRIKSADNIAPVIQYKDGEISLVDMPMCKKMDRAKWAHS